MPANAGATGPQPPGEGSLFFFKRVLDVTVTGLALLVLLDSGWPIIFSQERASAERWTRDAAPDDGERLGQG